MGSFDEVLRCIKCGKEYPLGAYYKCETCHGILDVGYDYEALRNLGVKGIFDGRCTGVWKYEELLPVKDSTEIVTLQEGGTPLYRCANLGEILGIKQLYLKDETRNPTSSFKDREMTVVVSKAKELGLDVLCAASSGNAGASLAAYAARAKLTLKLFVPSNTPSEKVVQALIYDADVVKVRGTYTDALNRATSAAQRQGWFHSSFHSSSTFVNPYIVEGCKTVAYEIFEQLKRIPDLILIPIGAGPLLVGCWKGFYELGELGLIKGTPRMVGVQAEGCSPIAKAFKRESSEVEAWGEPKTIASAIADTLQGHTEDGARTLEVIRRSKGLAETCDDKEIVDAVKLLAREEGIFAEPAGAIGVGALKKLIKDDYVEEDSLVVCVITGSGLKDTGNIMKALKGMSHGAASG